MKRIATMKYNETIESRELALYAENNGRLYSQMIKGCIENLTKKANRGTYDADRAVDLWYYVATEASKMYDREFGYSFSVADRFTAAVDLEAFFRDEVLC